MDGRSQLSRKGRLDVALIIQTVHWRPFQQSLLEREKRKKNNSSMITN